MIIWRCFFTFWFMVNALPVIVASKLQFSLDTYALNRDNLGFDISSTIGTWMKTYPQRWNSLQNSYVNPAILKMSEDLERIAKKFQRIIIDSRSINNGWSTLDDHHDPKTLYWIKSIAYAIGSLNTKLNATSKETLDVSMMLCLNLTSEYMPDNSTDYKIMIQMTDEINNQFPGSVTTILIQSFVSIPFTAIIVDDVTFIRNLIPENLKLGVIFQNTLDDCADTTVDESDDRKLYFVEDMSILLENIDELIFVPSFLTVETSKGIENPAKTFENNVNDYFKCEKNLWLKEFDRYNKTSIGIQSLYKTQANSFAQEAYYWWLIDQYAEVNNRTVIMMDYTQSPFIRNYLNDNWNTTELIDFDTQYFYDESNKDKYVDTNIPFVVKELDRQKLRMWIITGVATLFGLGMLSLFGLWLQRRYNEKANAEIFQGLSPEEIKAFIDGIKDNGGKTEHPWNQCKYSAQLEMQRDDFFVDEDCSLGSGNFGVVFRGSVKNANFDVAIKTVKKSTDRAIALKGLMSEIKRLSYLGHHENIIGIVGAYTAELSKGIIYVVYEFCSKGALDEYLKMIGNPGKGGVYGQVVCEAENMNGIEETRISKSQDKSDFVELFKRFAKHICSGMEYVASKKCVHGDLAARNVLLTSDLTAKIADFGLSKQLCEKSVYTAKKDDPMAWKWMAPETLDKLELSEKSDVWSYGITLWEIFTLGMEPYPNYPTKNNEFTNNLEQGLRLEKPESCDEKWYDIMMACWEIKPDTRSTFTTLLNNIQLMSDVSVQT